MNILGISCGSKMGNSEILLRQALMSAEGVGAEVRLLRINDFYIAPCVGCGRCEKPDADYLNDCVFEDDFPSLAQAVLNADGLILSAPVYNWSPCGQVKLLSDRFGPHYDAARAKGKADPRLTKPRSVGYISVGGTMNPHYASMGLGPMQQVGYYLGLQPVDQLLCIFATDKGHCLLREPEMAHAARLGENVARAALAKDFTWRGDAGTCPVCHNNMMLMEAGGKITCPFCDISGQVALDPQGCIQTDFSGADLSYARSMTENREKAYARAEAECAAFEVRRGLLSGKLDYYRTLDIRRVQPTDGGYVRKENAE